MKTIKQIKQNIKEFWTKDMNNLDYDARLIMVLSFISNVVDILEDIENKFKESQNE